MSKIDVIFAIAKLSLQKIYLSNLTYMIDFGLLYDKHIDNLFACDEFRRNVHICDNEITDLTMRPIAEAQEYDKQHLEKLNTLTCNIKKGFDKLSPRQRQIINLYYLEHRKYEDICRIMGINYQSVRNLMHRSICRLREYAGQVQIAV